MLRLSFLFLLPNLIAVASSAAPGCPDYRCGNIVDIRYPFWVSGNDTGIAYCGHPYLRLECSRGTPVLRLPSGAYGVTGIRYGNSSTISVFDVAFNNSTCPHVAGRRLVLPPGSPQPLSLTPRNRNVSFLLNCNFEGISSARLIPCLQNGQNRSFYFPDIRILPHQQARLCQEVVTVPVLSAVNDVLLALRAGFELSWTPAAGGQCHDCEKAGGFCGQLGEQFNCFSASKNASTSRGRKLITTRMIVYITIMGSVLVMSFISCCLIRCAEKRRAEAEAADSESDRSSFLRNIEMGEIRRVMHPVEDQLFQSHASPSSNSSGYGGGDEEDEAATRRRRGKMPLYA